MTAQVASSKEATTATSSSMEQPGTSKQLKTDETRKKSLPGSSRQSRYSLRSSDPTSAAKPPDPTEEPVSPPPLATAAALTVAAATAAATTVKVEMEKLIRKPPKDDMEEDEDDEEEEEEESENEMGRLQALLEARGLPPHLFGSLPQRMQQLLHRGIHHNTNVSKANTLLEGLESKSETLQLQSVIELCELLVMGNEDTLGGFPTKQTIPALVHLLGMDHNFDMMNHAVRALTYMMEALPRSIPVVAQLASNALISKLLIIQCMDVAEQCLTALEMVSKRHFKILVQKSFLGSALTYLDFFSIEAQRNALQIAANCCQNLRDDEFHMVRDAIPFLTARLLQNSDKKSIDIVCLAFSRIVDSFSGDVNKLDIIAGTGNVQFFPNLQQLLVITPPLLSGTTFILVLRMLTQLCSRCPQIAVRFLEHNIIATIQSLLFGKSEDQPEPPTYFTPGRDGEILELVQLLGELTPVLPGEGIFALTNTNAGIQWQFKDGDGHWVGFTPFDSKIIETSHSRGDEEVTLNSEEGTITIDFLSMQQTTEQSTVAIRRHFSNVSAKAGASAIAKDPRTTAASATALSQLLPQLIGLVNKSSAVNTLVKQSIFDTLTRLTYFLPEENVIQAFSSLKSQHEFGAQLANMLNNSHEKKIRLGAFQLIWVLFMEKNCSFYSVFNREGVFRGVQKLCEIPQEPKTAVVAPVPAPPGEKKGKAVKKASKRKSNVSCPHTESSPRKSSNGNFFNRFTRQQQGGASSSSSSSGSSSCSANNNPPMPTTSSKKGKESSKSKNNNSSGDGATVGVPMPGPSKTVFVQQQTHKEMQHRLKEYAETFLKKIPRDTKSQEWEDKLKSAVNLLNDPSTVQEGLESLKWILVEDSKSEKTLITCFELTNSGVVKSLTRFLSEGDNLEDRQRKFLHIFASLPEEENKGVELYSRVFVPDDRLGLRVLVSKLSASLTFLEQFEVKMHDVPRHSGSLRFFNTQQIKCNLERSPDCSSVGDWKGGTVKIDSLALVTTIERYLVAKVVNRATLYDSDQDDDEAAENGTGSPFLGSLGSSNPNSPSLELLCGATVLPPNLTIYEALRTCSPEDSDVFTLTHTIQYRLKKNPENSNCKNQTAVKTGIADPSNEIIELLTKIFALNRNFINLYVPQLSSEEFLVPKALFVNPRLSAKVARQLGDLISVMTGSLPKWIASVAAESGFLFGFELRVLLFYCFAFDKERAVTRIQSALFGDSDDGHSSHNHAHHQLYGHHRVMPRLDRRKKRFNRDTLLKEAISCFLNELPSPRTVLEIEYENEVGTGSGPTAEFYSLVSQQLLKDLKARGSSADDEDDLNGYFPPPFPKGMKGGHLKDLKNRYKVLGRLIWRAMLDQRLLDIHLSSSFWKSLIHGGDSLTLRDLPGPLGLSLKNMVISYYKNEDCLDDLGLFFTLPGHPNIPLKKGGKHIPVTKANLLDFVKLTVAHLLKNSPGLDLVRVNVECEWLKLFLDAEECQLLLCGLDQNNEERWNVSLLEQCCRCDHGYTLNSEPIRFLFQILCSFDGKQRRMFLHFITGSPRLPKNGLKDLKLTIVRKDDKNEEESFPSVMTCVNYLKLPPYSTLATMRSRLLTALQAFDSPFTLS